MPPDNSKALKRKPPACDRCKSKRVLCHPAPPGQSCPRCTENEVPCTTTPVVRRRPVRKPKAADNSASGSPDGLSALATPYLPAASGSASTESSQAGSPLALLSTWTDSLSIEELPRELIVDLFNCFRRLPQYNHPMLDCKDLRTLLEKVDWRPSLLPIDVRTLTYCVLASSAKVSVHPAILGPGPTPATPQELNDWPANTDWRDFGKRRAAACKTLREEAFRLAREAEVTITLSRTNVASCFLLDTLDLERANIPFKTSRPYAVAYMAHARSFAELGAEDLGQSVRWASFMAGEAVRSTQAGAPILFSPSDQRILHGDDVMTLAQLESHLRNYHPKHPTDGEAIFNSIRPYGKHVVDLSRQIDDDITGSFARRKPVSESTLNECISAIDRLGKVHTLFADKLAILRPVAHFSLFPEVVYEFDSHLSPGTYQMVLQSIKIFVAMGWSCLVLALHRELQRRAREEQLDPPTSAVEKRERERMSLMRDQVKDMAREAARSWSLTLRDMPSLPHLSHFRWLGFEVFGLVLLDEVNESQTLSIENATALGTILHVLKLLGFSHVDPSLDPIIAAIEAQLDPASLPYNLLLTAPPPPNSFSAAAFQAPPLSVSAAFAYPQQPSANLNDLSLLTNPIGDLAIPAPLLSPRAAAPLDLGRLESDLAAAHGQDGDSSMSMPMTFLDGMAMEDWFSTALLGMGGEGGVGMARGMGESGAQLDWGVGSGQQ